MEVIVKGQPSIEIGFETKVIQVGGLGDIDSSLSTESENPVMNKVVTAEFESVHTELDSQNELIEDLQNTKIDKEADDYYPQLAVGLADNLAGVDVVDSEVNFRRSGGGAISDGVARIEAIKGNSVVWNQLYSDTRFENGVGDWKPYGSTTVDLDADGSLLVTATSTTSRSIYNGRYLVPANHKILTIVDFKPNNIGNGQFLFYMKGSSTTETIRTYKYTKTERQIAYTIIEHDVKTYIAYYPIHNGEVGDTANIYSVVAYDLTQMFGAGNEPTTIEEFYARIPMGVDLNAYNEDEVIHMDVQSIESQGVNAWDEEWEKGNYNVNTGVPTLGTSYIMSKPDKPIKVLPNTKYYIHNGSAIGQTDIGYHSVIFFYDIDDNFIKRTSSIANSTFTTPQNCDHIRFYNNTEYGTTYKNDICINISDTSINGKYFPYIKRVEDLSVIRKYFPQGMKSAGTAHDEIRYNKATQKWEYSKGKIKTLRLADLVWYYGASQGYFYSKDIDNLKGIETNKINILCDVIVSSGWSNFVVNYGGNKATMIAGYTHATTGQSRVNILNAAYTDVSAFIAWLEETNATLYYESNDWEWVELDAEDQFRDLDYQVWNCGTEKAIAEGKSAPLAADITYGFNAIGKIKELESLVAQLRAKVGI